MTDQEMLQIYTGLVPFLAGVCGPGCEIVVHDVTDPEHSLIAIENSLSGRQVGDPLTDLSRELQEKGAYTSAAYIGNYEGKSKGKNFLSSTYFIKNEGRLIGPLSGKDCRIFCKCGHLSCHSGRCISFHESEGNSLCLSVGGL